MIFISVYMGFCVSIYAVYVLHVLYKHLLLSLGWKNESICLHMKPLYVCVCVCVWVCACGCARACILCAL